MWDKRRTQGMVIMQAALIGVSIACGWIEKVMYLLSHFSPTHVVNQYSNDKINNICYGYPIVLLILSNTSTSNLAYSIAWGNA